MPVSQLERFPSASPNTEDLQSPGKRRMLPKQNVLDGSISSTSTSTSSTSSSSSVKVMVGGESNPLHPKLRDRARGVDDSQVRFAFTEASSVAIEEEKPTLRKILAELRARTQGLDDKVATLAARAAGEVAEDPGPRDAGASPFAAKQTLLLSYCREVCAYASAKAAGRAMRGAGVAGRMVELRIVTEKLRPLDRKLNHQTDKLLRLASSGPKSAAPPEGDDSDDPRSFRPHPEVMAPWGKEADGSDEQVTYGDRNRITSASAWTGRSAESILYRAPRLSSVPYDEDSVSGTGAGSARSKSRLERRRDKLRRDDVVETIREEFGEQPETIRSSGNAGAAGVSEAKMKRLLEEDKDRLLFEENHMVRSAVTRKAKKARVQMEKDAGRLETIADVGSAADVVRVARDAGGFEVEVGGVEDGLFGGGRGRKGGRKGRGGLGRAMDAVGGSVAGGGGRG